MSLRFEGESEHTSEIVPVKRPTDEQDRVEIYALTDREIAEETLTYLRLLTDLMTEAAQNPILGKMFQLPMPKSLRK